MLGFIVAAATAAQDVVSAGGDPSKINWQQMLVAVAIAVFGRATKMVGVSNSPNPLPEAKPVVEPLIPVQKMKVP